MTDHLGSPPWSTLPGSDYHSQEVYEVDQERVFAGSWYTVARSETLPDAGDYLAANVAGEGIIVIRGNDGTLRAFANSCRHRGTCLLEGGGTVPRAIVCPYHGWTYGLDGRLLGTPNVGVEDGIDHDQLGLWQIALAEWGGFIFVNLDGCADPLEEVLAKDPESPLQFSRYGLEHLRVGARHDYEVAANWKVIVENYYECLHCPLVHPELVRLVPVNRRGEVEEEGQSPLGNTMDEGLTSFTQTGRSHLPSLPGLNEEDLHTFYGIYFYPNLIINYHSDTVNVMTIHPLGPERTRVVAEFLFDQEAMAQEGFDPSDVVDFRGLVARQDWKVCERVQQGVRSRFFEHGGVYPRQERAVAGFNRRYLDARGPLPSR